MLIGDGFHWRQSLEAQLPGEVRVLSKTGEADGGTDPGITLVNRLPLETYLECVVGSEMNPAAPMEFLKAHAVISRSWVWGKISGTHRQGREGAVEEDSRLVGWDDTAAHHGFHVCSDDHCQRYQGLQPIAPAALEAIRQTAGEVLLSPSGKVVDARFSKCCGGHTEVFESCWQSTHEECLEGFEDPWCDLSGMPAAEKSRLLESVLKDYDLATDNYGYRWRTSISKSDVRRNLREKFGRDVGRIQSLEVLHRGPSGRADRLLIRGSAGSLELGKELWIRRLLSDSHLYSSAFTVSDSDQEFILDGRGWGHGVGLCQIGAANMACHGFSYRDILSFYYPSSSVGYSLP